MLGNRPSSNIFGATARFKHWALVAASMLGVAVLCVIPVRRVQALPAYAQQTGQECAACHATGFPELTPYGRLFKLNGYTFGGGTSDEMPLAVMAYTSFTHTQSDQPGGAAPHFGANDNFALDQTSVFYGGEIAPNLGAFAQVTYDGVGRTFSWDNTDIRYARSFQLLTAETVWGVSLNNNPSVQDVWNTAPAWRFPYVASALAQSPAAATMIEGGFAQQVVGLTTYALWDRLIYLEAGGYRTLSPTLQSIVGVNSSTNDVINGVAPYGRLALQHDWGRNSLEAGLFGMTASIIPQRLYGIGTDRKTDVGIDSQYQFLGDRDGVSLQASAIFENQNLDASSVAGLTSNGHNTLRSINAKATYFYQQTYGATLGMFRLEGSPDATLYANASGNNSPNSTGIIGELDYIPFNNGGPEFFKWLNLKLGIQYIYYPEFNGMTGHAATANNTLYVFAWLVF